MTIPIRRKATVLVWAIVLGSLLLLALAVWILP